jgi:hypothetical protein
LVIGFAFNYILVQISVWTVLHAIFLFYGVAFPYSFRKLRNSGRIRYAHIISVILAVLLPAIGPCVLLRDGYVIISTPTLTCVGRNLDITYYGVILPISILTCITSCLLVLLFWSIFKVMLLFLWLKINSHTSSMVIPDCLLLRFPSNAIQ